MTTTSSTCAAPLRIGRSGWRYLRVRRFHRAKVATFPQGHGAFCDERPPGTVLAYRSPTMLWASARYAATELICFRNPDPRCYVTPSYTGGPSDAAVDGALRRPQCFGAYNEPWAQPHGAHYTVHAGPEKAVVIEESRASGWTLRLAGGTA